MYGSSRTDFDLVSEGNGWEGVEALDVLELLQVEFCSSCYGDGLVELVF